jgi:penicillin-binding protein 2
MADVVNPGGTAALSHLQNIDFAGKTGSAQTISNALKAKLGAEGKAKFKDNGWFVGVEPRRNPEIVVCTLLEEGEHGYLAARTAAKVIKAYVDKQRRQPQKLARQTTRDGGQVDVGAVWTTPDVDGDTQKLQSGHFVLDVVKRPPVPAIAAPGIAGTEYFVPSTGSVQ